MESEVINWEGEFTEPPSKPASFFPQGKSLTESTRQVLSFTRGGENHALDTKNERKMGCHGCKLPRMPAFKKGVGVFCVVAAMSLHRRKGQKRRFCVTRIFPVNRKLGSSLRRGDDWGKPLKGGRGQESGQFFNIRFMRLKDGTLEGMGCNAKQSGGPIMKNDGVCANSSERGGSVYRNLGYGGRVLKEAEPEEEHA